jgi:putative Ig domain-containing protein/glucodextranase-like protein
VIRSPLVVTFQGFAALVDFADVTTMRLRTLSTTLFVVLVASMLGTARTAAADTISLMWDANPEPEIAGYIVHVGTQSGTYTQHLDVGLSTSYSVASAIAGQQYCFAVSAYFAGPIEGSKSAEVCGFSNRPPTLVNPGARSSVLSQAVTLQLQGVDPDGQPVSYSATGLPPGLALQSSTGFISGAPTTAGSFTVNVTVSDGVLTVTQSFTWTVTAPDVTAPAVTITSPTSAATYSTTSSTMTMGGTASDNVAVTQVTWVSDRGGSGTASGTMNWSVAGLALQLGANIITVTARDAAGNTATDVVTVTYNTPPDTIAPVVTITGPTSAATYATAAPTSH